MLQASQLLSEDIWLYPSSFTSAYFCNDRTCPNQCHQCSLAILRL